MVEQFRKMVDEFNKPLRPSDRDFWKHQLPIFEPTKPWQRPYPSYGVGTGIEYLSNQPTSTVNCKV